MSNYFNCPNCGAEVSVKSKSCPECGSDDQTGWSEFTYMDTISIPDENEYMDILESEFSEKINSNKNKNWVVTTGILLLILIVIMVLKGIF